MINKDWSIEATEREESKEERLARERRLAEQKAEKYVFDSLDNCWFALCKRMREEPTAETQKAMNMVRRVIEETKNKFRSDRYNADKNVMSTDDWVRWLKSEDCIMDYPEAALDVAKRILILAGGITNPCLQWMLFIVNRECKEKLGKYLFPNDFRLKAYGPQYDVVYYNFCGFGGMPIVRCELGEKFVLIRKDACEIIGSVIREDSKLNLAEMCKKHMEELKETVDKMSTEKEEK